MDTLHDGGEDPAAALRLVQETQRKTAERTRVPAWHHFVGGGAIGLIIGSTETDRPTPLFAVAMCALVVMVLHHKKKTGTSTSSFGAAGSRARRVTMLGLGAILAVLGCGSWLKFEAGLDGAMIGAGIIGGGLAIWLSYAWQRAFLKDSGALR